MHPRASEFRDLVRERHGIDVEVSEFDEGTATAAEAAEAVGCEVDRIASSLVFDTGAGPVVVVASGADRVSERRLAAVLGVDADTVGMADPDRVREVTGWRVGGVPPLCHDGDPRVLVDRALLAHDAVYAAAGTSEALFRVDPERLRRLVDADAVDVTE
ncbi:MAG: YbaK/EbsC family protein [Haloferacaceae archaeon]